MHCFASLAVHSTLVRHEVAKLFTSTYENFMQTAGIRDGTSYCVKILWVFYDNLHTTALNDPEVILRLTYLIPLILHVVTLLHVIHICHDNLRYFDWDGRVHLAKGKTGGHQGDPLEMLIFNLTIHHLWDLVVAKFQETRAITYADDGYIKVKLSVALQVLAEMKRFLKEDDGLQLNITKTTVLPKGVSQQSVFDVVHGIINTSPVLGHLSGDVVLTSFCQVGGCHMDLLSGFSLSCLIRE